ncbi:hypothetical protein GCM10017767_16720 [Halomonas urumqiensis]|nr:hypothetical protein GCM10017767_16720 [Halomonas urumqiensis]
MSKLKAQSAWIRWRSRYRLYLSFLLAILALVNAVVRFWGEWELFFGALIGHGLFWQLIVAFLYDKPMIIGPGGADLDDGPAARGIALTFAITCYGVMFLFSGYPWG